MFTPPQDDPRTSPSPPLPDRVAEATRELEEALKDEDARRRMKEALLRFARKTDRVPTTKNGTVNGTNGTHAP